MWREAIAAGRANDELIAYENAWRSSEIGKDLKRVRNVKPMWSKLGTIGGVMLGGLDMWLNTIFGGWSPFGTWKHGKTDAASLEPASKYGPIAYPKPDGVLTFDRLSSVFLSNTNHEENEPVHLIVKDPGPAEDLPSMTSMPGHRHAIARPASMSGSRRQPGRSS